MDEDDFLAYVRRQAGSALRVIAWYDGPEAGADHIRDDLDPVDVEARVRHVHGELLQEWDEENESALADLGPLLASVTIHAESVILHFPLEDRRGYFLSLDPDVARNLYEFVVDCREFLDPSA